ncbi:hypothetical protein ABB37_03298 [Leptomonas pyrrhocoris]|uniref:Uncharacterized protein n=1 Tax=Leptomonas pyrrhocoris TaxID=157538 RepID=A0A0M9G4V8_LEPPY|nr:hypothetical protein ABB37_03298 [Leptomonas pyrrhocoris]KPA82169.1 hypothetical protein ABB37_03298 [Leptomonas pyrrhocoris]|eukprot:XP_015660608.1 hypothetical protein ABB37_03298 [Leptomonas pyrrhocoris]
MLRNMNSSQPRLPRLGGHKSPPMRKPVPTSTTPSGPSSLSSSARIEPARASNSPERPYIDVGYDDDDVPYAQQQVHLLATLRGGTAPSTPQQQAPSPPRPGRPSSSPPLTASSSSSAPPSWQEQVKSEVLLGPAQPRGSSPALDDNRNPVPVFASAALSGDTSSERDDGDNTGDTPQDSADRVTREPQNRRASRSEVLSAIPLLAATASPGIPITDFPVSPVSVASSLAADTPRSILRRPGRERDTQSPCSGHRRISFIDLSPLHEGSSNNSTSPENTPPRRESLSGEDDEDEFAEPMLRYATDTPAAATPEATSQDVHDGQRERTDLGMPPSSPPRSPDRHHTAVPATAADNDKLRHERSPDTYRDGHQQRRSASPSASPGRPVGAGRSPTRTPPRGSGEAHPPTPARTAVTASAPPPPEEENDVVTLDRASPPRGQQQPPRRPAAPPTPSPHPQRSPDRAGRGTANNAVAGRGGSAGRDNDVLTEPHNRSRRPSHSETGDAPAVVAPVGRRPPTRHRWPSDAYVDEPPTEVSTTQRGSQRDGAGRSRESLDPEDDMGSSATRSSDTSHDDYSSDAHSDNEPSFHYESPVKEAPSRHRSSDRARTPSPKAASPSRSPHRDGGRMPDRTRNPSPSHSRSPSGRLPERRTSKGASESRASGSRSSSGSRERPIPSTPTSLTEGLDRGMRQHRSPSREEGATPSLSQSTSLPSPVDSKGAKRRGEVAPPVTPREASHSGSHGRSPSTITSRSSGQSFTEETAAVAAPHPISSAAARTSPSQPITKGPSSKPQAGHGRRESNPRRGPPHREVSADASSADSSQPSSRRSSPSKKKGPSAPPASVAAAPVTVEGVPKRQHKAEKEEPQVYVDPLLRERQHRHDVARQQSPTYLTKQTPSAEAVAPPRPHKRHSTRRAVSPGSLDERGGVFEPVSLRDIMARHDTPEAKRSKSSSSLPSKKSSRASSVVADSGPKRTKETHRPTAHPILHQPRDTRERKSDPARPPSTGAVFSEKGAKEAPSVSSKRSSGGVPAEDLVWDAPTPTSRASSASPPASPTSPSAGLATTTGGHKVFHKKLVIVVRRKSSGAPPSESDPVMQVSMVPYREGSPAVRHAEECQEARQRERLARASRSTESREDARAGSGSAIGAVSASTTARAPPLERLIDHIQPGRKPSVSSRNSSRNTHIRESRVGEEDADAHGSNRAGSEDERTEEDRRQFRRALSAASSRSASRRSSVARSAHSRRPRSGNALPLRRSSSLPPLPEDKQQARNDTSPAKDTADKVASRKDSTNISVHSSVVKEKSSRSSSMTSVPHRRSTPAPPSSVVADENKDVASAKTRRWDESTMTPSRRRHHHYHRSPHPGSHRNSVHADAKANQPHRSGSDAKFVDSVSDRGASVEQSRHHQQPQPSRSPQSASDPAPSLPDAPYRPTQNDEYYFGAGLEKEVAQLEQTNAAPQRIGITTVTMPLLPRLTLAADGGEAGDGAWSASDGADGLGENDGDRIARDSGGSRRRRLMQASATQTDRVGPTMIQARGESGMPLVAATPVLRPSVLVESGVHAAAPVQSASFMENVRFAGAPASTAYAPIPATHSTFPSSSAFPAFGQPQQKPFFTPYSLQVAAPPFHNNANGAFPPPAATATTTVPLFVPPLTVDNVSHLTQDWQSTLRERSGRAKQNAMEQFLIASAEAGAASTLSSAYPRAAASGAADNMNQAANVFGIGVGAPADGGDPRRWPVQLQAGLPTSEYYGQPPQLQLQQQQARQASASAATPKRKSASAVKVTKAPKSAAAAKPTAPVASNGKPQTRPASLPQADAYDLVEGSDAEGEIRSGAGSDDEPMEAVDAVEPLPQPRPRATRHLAPPTSAFAASEQSTPRPSAEHLRHSPGQQKGAAILSPSADPIKPKESTRHKDAKPSRRPAAAAGSRRSLSKPATGGFTVAEPESEVSKPKEKVSAGHARHADPHAADRHDRGASAGASSASSRTSGKPKKDGKRRKEDAHPTRRDKKDKEEGRRKRKPSQGKRHGSRDAKPHRRANSTASSSLSSKASSTALFSIPDVFNFSHRNPGGDDDSDVDSDLATSMEFQLSRLQQQREKDVSLALSSLQHMQERAERKREKAAAQKRKKSRHHRRRSTTGGSSSNSGDNSARSGEAKKKHHTKDEKEKERRKKHDKRRRSQSAATKKSKKDDKHKSTHQRSKSASKADPLPLPPPPPSQAHDAWPGDATPSQNRADRPSGESRYSTPPYEPIGTSRYRGALPSTYARPDYPSRVPFRAAEGEGQSPRSFSPSYFRSRSNGLDNSTQGDGLASSRHAPRRAFTASSATPRWTGTPPRSYEVDDDVGSSPGLRSAYSPRSRPESRAARPFTRWNDYVREAERSDRTNARGGNNNNAPTASRYSSPSSASPRYTPYGQRRGSSGGDTASPRAGVDSFRSRPSPSTNSRYKPSYPSRTADYDDIDDIPKRSYFNDNAADAYGSTGRRRSPSAEGPPPSHRRQWRGTEAPRTTKADDILVSTPSQDRDDSSDYWEERGSGQTQPRHGAPPPPPSLPRDSRNGSTHAPSTANAAFEKRDGVVPASKALPIVSEHNVTDALTAHDFAEGVEEIVSALRQYKEGV